MLLILPPVNGPGIRVHRVEDVEDTLRTVINLCPANAQIALWWYDGDDLRSRLIIGVNGPENTGGLKYCDEDGETWIPRERGDAELHFSDGHALLDFAGGVSEEAVVAAVVDFAAGGGNRPAALVWEEEWRLWDSDPARPG